MRILAVADARHPAIEAHFDPTRWRGVELVIGCGDLPGDYLDYIATSLGVPLLYVRGNHDSTLLQRQGSVGENLDGRIVRHKGLTIVGFEGSAWYGGRGVEYTQLQMHLRVWATVPRLLAARKLDIVVTHAPPALRPSQTLGVELESPNSLDLAKPPRESFGLDEGPGDYAHRGFSAFTAVLHRFRPRLWLHGHTHLNYSRAPRVRRYADTFIANAYEYLVFNL